MDLEHLYQFLRIKRHVCYKQFQKPIGGVSTVLPEAATGGALQKYCS